MSRARSQEKILWATFTPCTTLAVLYYTRCVAISTPPAQNKRLTTNHLPVSRSLQQLCYHRSFSTQSSIKISKLHWSKNYLPHQLINLTGTNWHEEKWPFKKIRPFACNTPLTQKYIPPPPSLLRPHLLWFLSDWADFRGESGVPYMCHGQKSLYWGWSSHL